MDKRPGLCPTRHKAPPGAEGVRQAHEGAFGISEDARFDMGRATRRPSCSPHTRWASADLYWTPVYLPAQYLHIRCKIGSRTGPIAKRLCIPPRIGSLAIDGSVAPGQMTEQSWLPVFWYTAGIPVSVCPRMLVNVGVLHTTLSIGV